MGVDKREAIASLEGEGPGSEESGKRFLPDSYERPVARNDPLRRLIFLLIFILQNSAPVQIIFLNWTGALPTGVALLFAAIAGVLLVALPGAARMLQLRRAAPSDRDRAH